MGLYETIQYDLVKKEGKIEIRKYKDILLASTKTMMNSSRDSGFSHVFNYISGSNEEEKKISMTTPVVTYQEDNQLVTGFYVPSKYNKDTVPKPKGKQVFINEITSSLYGVIQFKGKWTKNNYDTHDQILINYLHDNNYNIISQRFIFRYQPPMFPGFLRRNEIAYKISIKKDA
jgi:hypothetical protein